MIDLDNFIRFRMDFPILLFIPSYIISERQLFSLRTYSIIEIYFHVTLFDKTIAKHSIFVQINERAREWLDVKAESV